MDSNFVDLDILLTRIRDSRSKVYFHEAVKAYKAGALRAALSSAWVAVVYDLIAKFRELSTSGDRAAATFVETWDAATTERNIGKLLEMEANIISYATDIQLLDPIAQTHLRRLREDRNLCAHPTFSDEASLFEPSPEMVRAHFFNAINLVLSQTPLQGKAILNQFSADVQSPGFPTDRMTIQEYIENHYLKRARPHMINNFGVVLAKSLLKGVPDEWDNHRGKIVESLMVIRERAPNVWPELVTTILALLNSIEPSNRVRAIAFTTNFPSFWPKLDKLTQTALIETAKNTKAEDLDYHLLLGIKNPELEQSIMNLIDTLSADQLRNILNMEVFPELWPIALKHYEDSDSFRGSESNYQSLISPFCGFISSEQFDDLLAAIASNSQNWNAADTPQLLSDFLVHTPNENWPTSEGRNRLFHALSQCLSHAPNFYAGVFKLLQKDGWVPPQDDANEDDEPF